MQNSFDISLHLRKIQSQSYPFHKIINLSPTATYCIINFKLRQTIQKVIKRKLANII